MAYKKIVDISEHDASTSKPIDFKKVKESGVYGVIIRCGYGTNHTDSEFHKSIKGAIAAGLHIGIYWFAYSYSVTGAKTEAKNCLEIIKPYKKNIDLGVWYDFEYDSWDYANRFTDMSNWLLNEMTKVWCDTVKEAGYKVGVYFNSDYYEHKYDKNLLNQYLKWYAYYNPTCDIKCHVWQYSSSAEIPGIPESREDVNWLVDGSFMGKTVKTLYPGKFPAIPSGTELKLGDTGSNVKLLQKYLNWYGFDLEVDGSFGPATEKAVIQFSDETNKHRGRFGQTLLSRARKVKR